MAEDSKRIVELTQRAKFDISVVDFSTSSMWGEAQAERYLDFLRSRFELLLENPTFGTRLESHAELRYYTAQQSTRRTSHGHRIIY